MTFGGYLENIRRRCHKRHSQRSGGGGGVPGTGRNASVPGPGAGGPFRGDSEGELEGQRGKQVNCEKGTE